VTRPVRIARDPSAATRPPLSDLLSKWRSLAVAALTVSLVLGRTAPAVARAGGIVTDDCHGCHGSGTAPPTLTLTADPSSFNPGDLVTFTLVLRSSTIKVGGAYITSGGVGTLKAIAGEGLQINGQGLTHTSPKAAVNGAVTFRFGWQAPAQPGGLDIGVAALAANGNNANTGDSPGSGDFQWAFGCTAQTYYLDLDRDGYGSEALGTRIGCAGSVPTGYAAMNGDCDENDEKVHPGATEICNRKDDNCDAQIDEGSVPAMMWPDQDGDGYYKSQQGTPKIGCGDVPGYAVQGGDCNDQDPAVHPGAVETCNVLDDNCNGQIDEGVRPRCGVGWCARLSPTCNLADCHPGPPMAEICNSFDDDCDGQIDNGTCQPGTDCAAGGCPPSSGSGGNAGQPAARAGGGGSAIDTPSAGSANPSTDSGREGGCAVARPKLGSKRTRPGSADLSLAVLGVAACVSVVRRRARRR